MKKFREFLFLFVPLIVFTVLPVIIFIGNQTTISFASNNQYLKLFFKDSVFWVAILNTYYKPIVFSAFAVICFAVLCHFVKFIKSRKVFFSVSIALAGIVSFLVLNSVSIYAILFSLQIGFLTTFLFWLVETIFLFIKTKKSHTNLKDYK